MAIKLFFLNLLTICCLNAHAFSFKPFKEYLSGDDSKDIIEKIATFESDRTISALKKMHASKIIKNKPDNLKRFKGLLNLLSEEIENDDVLDVVDEILTKVNDRLDYFEKSKSSFFPLVTAQYNSWQDHFTLKNLDSNIESRKNGLNRGPCFGGGAEYGNSFYRISLDLCLGFLAVFSNTDLESGVKTTYLKTRLGYSYFLGERSRIGTTINLLYRSSDFNVPARSELNGTTYLNIGGSLDYHFKLLNSLYFFSSVGGYISSGTLSWNNGFNWIF